MNDASDIINEMVASIEPTQISIPNVEKSLENLVRELNEYIEERNNIICRMNELSIKYAEIQNQNRNMELKLAQNEQKMEGLKTCNAELEKIIHQKNREIICQKRVINPIDADKLKRLKHLYYYAKKITGVKFTVVNEHYVELFIFNEHTGYLKHCHFDSWRNDIVDNLWQLVRKGCIQADL